MGICFLKKFSNDYSTLVLTQCELVFLVLFIRMYQQIFFTQVGHQRAQVS